MVGPEVGRLMGGNHLDDADVEAPAQVLHDEARGPDPLVADDDHAQAALAVLAALERGADVQRDVDGLNLGDAAPAVLLEDLEVVLHRIEHLRLVGDHLAQDGIDREARRVGGEHRLEVVGQALEQAVVAVEVHPAGERDVLHELARHGLHLHVLDRELRVAAEPARLEDGGEALCLALAHAHAAVLREQRDHVPGEGEGLLALGGGDPVTLHPHSVAASLDRDREIAAHGPEGAIVEHGLVEAALLVEDLVDCHFVGLARHTGRDGRPLLGERRLGQHEIQQESS